MNPSGGVGPQIKRALGALRSGHPAAHLGMIIRAISPLTSLIDSLLFRRSRLESLTMALPPCLMLVSPPRSGSTIVYQVLVRTIPAVYISNFHALFTRCASSYMLKHHQFGKGYKSFQNYYGHTSHIFDVNEGNELVEALFQDGGSIQQVRHRFRSFVQRMGATTDRPLIFKNVRAYPNLLTLHQAVPELRFLRVRRDPERIIQSVVRAYRELGTFHPVPDEMEGTSENDPVFFAVRQIMTIERVIDDQMARMTETAWLAWSYEDFCRDTQKMVEELAEKSFGLKISKLRPDVLQDLHLNVSTRRHVNENDEKRIRELIEKVRVGSL